MLVTESVIDKVKMCIKAHGSISDLCIDLLLDEFEHTEDTHVANAIDELECVK